jgi:hypothetical protein
MAFAGTFGGGLSALTVGDATYTMTYKRDKVSNAAPNPSLKRGDQACG